MKTAVALLLAAIWVAASGWMVYHFGYQEDSWDHFLVAYNAISSVGFAAIGGLLGVQVNQVDLTKARADADKKTTAIRTAIQQLTPAAGDAGGGAGEVHLVNAAVTHRNGLALETLRAAL